MYCSIQTQFKNTQALVEALAETGNWNVSQIEVHKTPQNLYGYKGDVREDVAHIIIRRAVVGGASNDIGFLKQEDGTYKAIISKYDRGRHNDQWIGNLKGNYAFHVIKNQQRARGRQVERQRMPDGRQRLIVKGYR